LVGAPKARRPIVSAEPCSAQLAVAAAGGGGNVELTRFWPPHGGQKSGGAPGYEIVVRKQTIVNSTSSPQEV